MMREEAFKVYYTKGLICSSNPAENRTKPVTEKGEKGDTAVPHIGKPASAGIIRTFILKIWTFFAAKYALLKRPFFSKKMSHNGKEWRVIYRVYKHYNH
jgi:hypothetical protein